MIDFFNTIEEKLLDKINKKVIILFISIIIVNVLQSCSAPEKRYGVFENRKDGKEFTSFKSAKNKVEKAKKLEKKGKAKKAEKLYEEAFIFLKIANKKKQVDPNTLNYLGYVSKKLGKKQDAEIYYLLGLDISPRHNELTKNLGELYLETGRISKAKKRLKILEKCNCEEFLELKSLISNY